MGADQLDRFAHRGAGGNHVVDNQHPALQRRANQHAALAVVFGFFAVEGKRNVQAVFGQHHRRGAGQVMPLVGRAKQHVEFHAAGADGLGVKRASLSKLAPWLNRPALKKYGDRRPAL